METYELFASGLGLIFSSSGALRSLAEDGSAVDQGAIDAAFDRLCREQKAFLLATGSPELYYEVQVHRQDWPPSVAATLQETVGASLFLEGEELVIRDGYDLEAWVQRPEAAILVPTSSACCRLKIGVAPSAHHGTMQLHILLEEGAEPFPGPEMIELLYRAPSERDHG